MRPVLASLIGFHLTVVSVTACAADAPSGMPDLLTMFRTRLGAVRTFRADVEVTSFAGRDRQKLVADMDRFFRWANRKRGVTPERQKQHEENMRDLLSVASGEAERYRYLAQSNGRFRVERLRADAEPIVSCFTGECWQLYYPRTPLAPGPGELTLYPKTRGSHPFEVARGEGVMFHSNLANGLHLSARSEATQEVLWDDIWRNVPADRIKGDMAPTPLGGGPQPMLEIVTPPAVKDVSHGWCRLRLWFDKALLYCPLYLESCILTCDSKRTTFEYIRASSVEWSQPVRLENGIYFPTKARVASYHPYCLPKSNDSDDLELQQAYEFSVTQFVFSKVLVNEPLDESVFSVTPPQGTHVLDEIKGHAYVVGPAGEQLRKFALEQRAQNSPMLPQPTSWSRRLLIYGGLAAVICLALFVAYRWHRLRRKTSVEGE